MRDLKLDVDTMADLIIENNDLVLVEDGAECAQSFVIRFRTIQTEWVLDIRLGLDILDFFAAHHSMEYREAVIRSIILKTPGVEKIKKLELYVADQDMKLYVDAEVITTYSDIAALQMGI